MNKLPEVHFGIVEDIDWKSIPDPTEDDEDAPTPDYIIKVLGFNPDDES